MAESDGFITKLAIEKVYGGWIVTTDGGAPRVFAEDDKLLAWIAGRSWKQVFLDG